MPEDESVFANVEAQIAAVIAEYKKQFGDDWLEMYEKTVRVQITTEG